MATTITPNQPPAPPTTDAEADTSDPLDDQPLGRRDDPAPAAAAVEAGELVAPDAAGALGPVWEALADRAAHYATRARGAGTRRTYRSAWTPLLAMVPRARPRAARRRRRPDRHVRGPPRR